MANRCGDTLRRDELDALDVGRPERARVHLNRPLDVELASHREASHMHVEQDLGAARRVAPARANRVEDRLACASRGDDGGQPGSKRIALSTLAVMPEESVAVRVRDEPETQAAVEQGLGELVVKLAPVPERVIGMLVAAVAGADLPNRLPHRVVTRHVGPGPTDVVRPGERALRADLLDDVAPAGTSSREMIGRPGPGR